MEPTLVASPRQCLRTVAPSSVAGDHGFLPVLRKHLVHSNNSVKISRVLGLNNSSFSNVASRAGASGLFCRTRLGNRTSTLAATLQESIIYLISTDTANGGAKVLLDGRSRLHANDYIGYGDFVDNGSFFRERFVIRFSEAGPGGTITLETFASLLQEAASNHVLAMAYQFSDGKNFDGNLTVTTRMHIEVDRYPVWRDLLEIDTWFQREGKNSVRRDWIVKDIKTGQQIAFVTSTWVLMNSRTRRLTKITDLQWAEIQAHLRHPPMWALSEDRLSKSSAKIAKLGDDAEFKIPGLIAVETDCDMNQHVNNIKYISWMLESIPAEVKRTHEVSKITLEYRQEASQGEVVESLASLEDDPINGSTGKGFTHLIQSSDAGKEINRGRTVWRPIQ